MVERSLGVRETPGSIPGAPIRLAKNASVDFAAVLRHPGHNSTPGFRHTALADPPVVWRAIPGAPMFYSAPADRPVLLLQGVHMFKKTIYFTAAALLAAVLTAAAAKPGAPKTKAETEAHSMISAGDTFAFKLYSQFAKEEGNIFFSPYSITVALAMTLEGARGGTAAEMEKVLGLPEDAAMRRKFFALDTDRLGSQLGVDMANAFWAQNDHKLLPRYTGVLKKYYRAEAFGADFAAAPDKTRLEINAWTADRTRGKVPDLFPENSLTTLTKLVLVDAVYFKGEWKTAFDKARTAETDFFTAPESVVKVNMMQLSGENARFNYAESPGLQILELPYRNDRLSMLLLLPAQGGLKELERTLSPEQLSAWKQGLYEESVDVYLPRFVLNAKYNLPGTLAEMGMPAAFTLQADFSGMDGKKDLYIRQAVHQGFVEVNEEGTEAAAATGVSMDLKSMPMPAARFRADRPFLFLIQERETGRIIFMGRVQKP
jgi:serpin B